MVSLDIRVESWPIRGVFRISRGAKTAAEVVVAELRDKVRHGTHHDTYVGRGYVGRGECVPYARYGESVESVCAQIESVRARIEAGMGRDALQDALPAGAARNALDCAFWDLEAKRAGKRAWELAGLVELSPITTAYTLSLDTPRAMQSAAQANAARPLLKLKLAGPDDLDRVAAARAGAPKARLIVDANEGWTGEIYESLAPSLVELGVEMIEQPLPAGEDDALASIARPVPVCADESCHDRASLDGLGGRYDMINIKLDKTGGLTEALALKAEAERRGFQIMVGSMLSTSLAAAPALIVAQGAKIADLDGPLLLAGDREPGLGFTDSTIAAPPAELWG